MKCVRREPQTCRKAIEQATAMSKREREREKETSRKKQTTKNNPKSAAHRHIFYYKII